MNSDAEILPVILSRLGSLRLPAKSLLEVIPGTSLLALVHKQLLDIPGLLDPILATSTAKEDDVLENFGRSLGIQVFRGSEDNVLKRLYDAATGYRAAYVLRINCDSPIIDRTLIQGGVSALCSPGAKQRLNYITNLSPRSYPYGISLQIVKKGFLAECLEAQLSSEEKEHITPAIESRLSKDSVLNIYSPLEQDLSSKRLTIDTFDDYCSFCRLLSKVNILDDEFSWWQSDEILAYLRK